jgi:integrase/recombinase XerC
MTEIQKYNADLMTRAVDWYKLKDTELRLEVAKAINERDHKRLWDFTAAYIVMNGKSGSQTSPETIKTYKTGVLQLLEAWQGENLLRPSRNAGRIYIRTLEAIPLPKTGKPPEPATVRNRKAAAETFYRALRFAGVTEANPFQDVNVRPDKTEAWEKRQPYTLEEVDTMVERAEKKPRTKAIILLSTHAGLRSSEISGLKWSDVDLTRRRLKVQGKGKKTRNVMISRTLGEFLAEMPRVGEFVVGISRQNVYARLRTVGGRGAHAGRHTSGHRAYRETKDLNVVATHLGHSSIDTTRIYAKGADDQLERTVGEW